MFDALLRIGDWIQEKFVRKNEAYVKQFIIAIAILTMLSTNLSFLTFASSVSKKKTIRRMDNPAELAEFLCKDRDDEHFFHHLQIDTVSGEVSVDGKETSLEEQFKITKKEKQSLFGKNQKENAENLLDFIDKKSIYATQENDEAIDVISPYQMKRIILKANDKTKNSIETFDAKKTIYYSLQDSYILEYEDEQKTKEAYEQLEQLYGDENVILDLYLAIEDDAQQENSQQPDNSADATAQGTSSRVCWGTSVMGLGKITKAVNQNPSLQNVTVAILDTGIDTSHEMFAGRTILGESKSFVTSARQSWGGPGFSYEDDQGHGTHVAGIISDATPVNMQFLVLKVLDSKGSGSSEDVILAVDYAAQMGADVINMSLGCDWADNLGYGHDSEVYQNIALEEASFLAARESGSIICAASGNGDKYGYARDIVASLTYPAVSNNVISVGSMDKSFTKASTSNYGEALDFIAPGVKVKSARYGSDHGYVTMSGTSMAAPAISAAAAFVKLYHPNYQFDQVYKELKSLALDLGNPGFDSYYGWGYVKFSASYDKTWVGNDDDNDDPISDDDDEDSDSLWDDIWNKIDFPKFNPGDGSDTPEPSETQPGDTTEIESTEVSNSSGSQSFSPKLHSQTIILPKKYYKKSYKSDLFFLNARANTKLTFSSSNPSIATVSKNGWVRTKSPGKTTIKITALQDSDYKSTSSTVNITVLPVKVSFKKAQAKNRNLYLVWKKDKKADGYIVRYSTNKSMKRGNEINISGSKNTKKVIKKLKKNSLYYVQVRSYSVDADGDLILGEWSKKKKIRMK